MGPEVLGFEERVPRVRRAMGARALLAPVPPALLLLASRLLRPVVGDVALAADEIAGLLADLLVSRAAPTAMIRFTEWLDAHASELGVAWANELGRHDR